MRGIHPRHFGANPTAVFPRPLQKMSVEDNFPPARYQCDADAAHLEAGGTSDCVVEPKVPMTVEVRPW